MTAAPTRAAFHRLIGVDTRISIAAAELSCAARDGGRALVELGVDLAPMVAALEANLETIRARARSMFDEPYPQQPEAGQ